MTNAAKLCLNGYFVYFTITVQLLTERYWYVLEYKIQAMSKERNLLHKKNLNEFLCWRICHTYL